MHPAKRTTTATSAATQDPLETIVQRTYTFNLAMLLAHIGTEQGKQDFDGNKITGFGFRFDDENDANSVLVNNDADFDGEYKNATMALRVSRYGDKTFLVLENTSFVQSTDGDRDNFIGAAAAALLQGVNDISTRRFTKAGEDTAVFLIEYDGESKYSLLNGAVTALDMIPSSKDDTCVILASCEDGKQRVQLVTYDDLVEAIGRDIEIVAADQGMELPEGAVLTPVPVGSKAAFGLYFAQTNTTQWFDAEYNQITGTDEVKGAIFPAIGADGKRTFGTVTVIGDQVQYGLDVDGLQSESITTIFGARAETESTASQ